MERLLMRAEIPDTLTWGYEPEYSYSIEEGLHRIFHAFDFNASFTGLPRILEIVAGVGVGKTIIIPFLIHKFKGCSVIIAVPKISIALGVQAFMNEQLEKQGYKMHINTITGQGSKTPSEQKNITIVTFGVLELWLKEGQNTSLNNCCIIFDESHNQDQFAAIVIFTIIRERINNTSQIPGVHKNQPIWCFQSATPHGMALTNYFYDGIENPIRNAQHSVYIQISTPHVNISHNNNSGANHTEDIWNLLRCIAPNKRGKKKKKI